MPSTDRKLALQAKDIDVSTVSQLAVCSSGLRLSVVKDGCSLFLYVFFGFDCIKTFTERKGRGALLSG